MLLDVIVRERKFSVEVKAIFIPATPDTLVNKIAFTYHIPCLGYDGEYIHVPTIEQALMSAAHVIDEVIFQK